MRSIRQDISPARPSVWPGIVIALVAGLIVAVIVGTTSALAQEAGACDTRVFIEQDGVVLLELPRQAGEKFTLDPDKSLRLRVQNAPESGSAVLSVVLPLGQRLTQTYNFTTAGPAAEHAVDISPSELGPLKDIIRGIYPVEVSVNSPDKPPCFSTFQTRIGDAIISGAVPAATAGATAVGVVATVAVSAWAAVGSGLASSAVSSAASSAVSVATSATASVASVTTTAASTAVTAGTSTATSAASGTASGAGGTAAGGTSGSASGVVGGGAPVTGGHSSISDALGFNSQTQVEVELQRRRKRGWRRYIPVPNWKRTIIGSTIGTVTGILASVFLQQGGLRALTTPTILVNAFTGAFGSFGCTLVIGSAIKWIRNPASEEEEKEELEVEGAHSTISQ